MKTLIVSYKNAAQVFSDFRKALKSAEKGAKSSHLEISFDNKRDFERFARNILVLQSIIELKPNSISELAEALETDVSNLNKIILFFEELGALKVVDEVANGRKARKPVVEYDSVRFDLRGPGRPKKSA